jgi:hypothetical protein
MAKRPFEFYETAPWQVDALIDHLPEIQSGDLIWCPTVGDGSIVKRLQQRISGLSFFTNDLDPEAACRPHGDATDVVTWQEMLIACGQAAGLGHRQSAVLPGATDRPACRRVRTKGDGPHVPAVLR